MSLNQSCKYVAINNVYKLYLQFLFVAAQMWALAINLPLMIGSEVPSESELWECFLLLPDILQLCMARVSSYSQAAYLKALIYDYHILFVRCYPNVSVTPKMHYMVHFPQQIIR